MPKKAKKRAKIVVQSNSDDDDDTFKNSKKKGRKGKTCFQNSSMIIASAISQIFWPVGDVITIILHYTFLLVNIISTNDHGFWMHDDLILFVYRFAYCNRV